MTVQTPDSGHHVRAVLARTDFRRLFGTRIASQIGDGIFQAGLAGTVLFNPDRQTSAMAIAIGFAVLLLPYSVVGPLAGVMLDKWSRRHVLVTANLLRAGLAPVLAAMIWFGASTNALVPLTLVAIGVQRFFQAGLSASLPHVTDDEQLITANSLSTMVGGIAYSSGIVVALGLRAGFGASNHGYATVMMFSLVGYVISAVVAARFAPRDLGPDLREKPKRLSARQAIKTVLGDMRSGARHLASLPSAGYTLLAVSAARVCYGIGFLTTLLLYRNYLESHGFFLAGEGGIGQVLLATGAGNFLAATITPTLCRRFTPRIFLTALLALGAVTEALLVTPYLLPTLLAASFFKAVAAQGGKLICETALQHESADDYRGRAFSVYDTVYNVCMVAGLLVAALILPETGVSYAMIALVSIGYLAMSVWYLLVTRNAGGITKASGREFDSLTLGSIKPELSHSRPLP